MYPEDEKEVLKLRAQKKPVACYLPFKVAHTWSPNKNGIRYCFKCGKVDFYFGMFVAVLCGHWVYRCIRKLEMVQ